MDGYNSGIPAPYGKDHLMDPLSVKGGEVSDRELKVWGHGFGCHEVECYVSWDPDPLFEKHEVMVLGQSMDKEGNGAETPKCWELVMFAIADRRPLVIIPCFRWTHALKLNRIAISLWVGKSSQAEMMALSTLLTGFASWTGGKLLNYGVYLHWICASKHDIIHKNRHKGS